LDFSPSFRPLNLFAWPTTLQINLKNNAESSPIKFLRDVPSERFQTNILDHSEYDGEDFFE